MRTYTNVGRNAKVTIVATCPYEHETVVAHSDIEANSSECELCGSHGDVELIWFCQECDTGYIYTLDSW